MNTKQDYGHLAYAYAKSLLRDKINNNQTLHYLCKLYGRLVITFGPNGTDAEGNLYTQMTRYKVLDTLKLLHHKSYYMKKLAVLFEAALLDKRIGIDHKPYVVIRTNLTIQKEVKNNDKKDPEWLKEYPRITEVFDAMDKTFAHNEEELWSLHGDLIEWYCRLRKGYKKTKARYIHKKIKAKAKCEWHVDNSEIVSGIEILAKQYDLDYHEREKIKAEKLGAGRYKIGGRQV